MNMQESGPSRDLSRGHFERSVGVAITNQVMEPFYRQCQTRLGDINLDEVTMRGSALAEWQQLSHKAWGMAYVVTELALDPNRLQLPSNSERDAVDSLLSKGMFAGSIDYSMHDGVNTQAHFPIRLAHDISVAARAQRVRGFKATNLRDIASIIRRPDFRATVDSAAATANGVWGLYSTTFDEPLPATDGMMPPLGFAFAPDGTVSFSPEVQQFLTDAMRKVNLQGALAVTTDAELSAASSGCPARRIKPSFLDTPEDNARLALLSRYFKTSPAVIKQPVDLNIINQGLELTAHALDYVHNEIQMRSPVMVLLAKKIGHSVSKLWTD
jgi:hypothetical protein